MSIYRKMAHPALKNINILAKNVLTYALPYGRMFLPVKKGYFFAAIFQLRAVIVVRRFLNFYWAE